MIQKRWRVNVSVIHSNDCSSKSSIDARIIRHWNMVCRTTLFLRFLPLLSMRFSMSMSYHLLPDAQIIVNMDEGYSLRRIGTFSSTLGNHFIHTFISIDDLCVASSSSDVCMYAAESTKSTILELATMIGNRLKYTSSSDMSKVKLSNLISDNLDQPLAHYHPDRIFSPLPFSSGDVDRSEKAQQSRPVSRFSPATLATILHQINNQKLGFDFMNDRQIDVLLKFLFKHIDQSLQTSNSRQSLEMSYRLIIAQSVFMLPQCSMDQQFPLAKPCSFNHQSMIHIRLSSTKCQHYLLWLTTKNISVRIFQRLLVSIVINEWLSHEAQLLWYKIVPFRLLYRV